MNIIERIVDFNQKFSGTFFDYYTLKEKEEYDKDTMKIKSYIKLRELVEENIKECKRNAGGMVYGLALEKLIKESEKND